MSEIEIEDISSLNEESFLPNFIKEHNVMLCDKNATTSDLIQLVIEKYGPTSAFYIINIGEVIRRVQLWKKLFPTVESCYAVKANPNPILCKLLAACGVGFDVASIDEINIVKNLVNDKSKIIFAHPIKPTNSIVYSRVVDVDNLVFDSEHELYKIKLHHPKAKLFMRLKVNDSKSLCKFSDKFGVPKEDIEFLLDLAHKMNLNVVGISFHVGSGCKDALQYYEAIELAKYAFDVAKNKDYYTFNILDLGGGFSGGNDLESMQLLNEISTQVYRALKDFFDYDIDNNNGLKIIAEQGRFYSTESHKLVLNVIGKKIKIDKETKEKSQTIYLNDGTYGSFSSIKNDHQTPIILPYNNDDIEKYRTRVEGNSCDSIDLISENMLLPELEVSDMVYVEAMGAYSLASSSKFNGLYIKDFFYVMT